MDKLKTLKGAALVVATSMLALSQAAMADVSISGWINEGVTFYDDGVKSDAVQISDNGTTLGSRMTFAGSSEVASGLTAGFEVILEPSSTGALLGFGSTNGLNDDANGHDIGVLGNSVNISGAWGKLTFGLQSMPTDNIAVLEDPSLTLWSTISPIFRGNSVTIQGLGAGASNTTWGSFLQCLGVPGLGIGIDCNGIYRSGVRYDLPAFGPVTIAIGHANDDVYDIAAKYKGTLGRMSSQLALGYSINQGGGGSNTGGSESETFQIQAGLMDPASGVFGSFAYQSEEADDAGAYTGDDTDAWWLKVGVKKAWFAAGDTSISFQYGQYSDQFGLGGISEIVADDPNTATIDESMDDGISGSEVQRIGISIDQYFGNGLIIYGVWEQLDVDVDCLAAASVVTATCVATYADAEELNMFTLGATYFF